MNDAPDAARLTDQVAALVEAAKKAGADAADAVAVRGRSTSVSVRLGKVESTNASEGDDVSLRVFVGKRVASVSATASSDPARSGRARRRHGEGLAGRSLSGPGRRRTAGKDGARPRSLRSDRGDRRRAARKRARGRGSSSRRAGRDQFGRQRRQRRPRRAGARNLARLRRPLCRLALRPFGKRDRRAGHRHGARLRIFVAACISPTSIPPKRSGARPASAPCAG